LREVLGEAAAARVEARRIVRGVLTLAVADSVLLAELRSHRAHALLGALAARGTGVLRLAWELRCKRPGSRPEGGSAAAAIHPPQPG
jgi:hypothetical protein